MTTSPTRKQREGLAVAKGLARGLATHQIAAELGINPGAAFHHARRLRHLRLGGAELAQVIAATDHADVDAALLALFVLRRKQQKSRSRDARRAKGGAA